MPIKHSEVQIERFNRESMLPFELRINDIQMAMQDVYDFFYDVNSKTLHRGGLAKLRGSWIYKDLD